MSKGSARRPAEVPSEVVDANWDNIFGKKDKVKETIQEDHVERDILPETTTATEVNS